MNPKVDEFINNARKWGAEMAALRSIILSCGLIEEFKWRAPCYSFKNSNLILIGAFKENCVISFVKGALLKDADGILTKPGDNSHAARIRRFTNVEEIVEMESILRAYIFEAIEVEKAGLKVNFNNNANLDFSEELQTKLTKSTTFKTAFEALTPGRQRGYNMYFSAAKQSNTRIARIEKYTQRILDGKGINDCVCGHSKKPPNCDGTHKFYR